MNNFNNKINNNNKQQFNKLQKMKKVNIWYNKNYSLIPQNYLQKMINKIIFSKIL